ncbi:MAG TPA: metallophosphoesterase family protein, partial [Spirochaetia bacterium]|nr:metallophosphoesterase family protein [Spirochaetia bacterium]
NHDKAVAGLMDLDWFNPVAREAALWTRRSMSEDLLDRLRRLPQGPVRLDHGILLCHGTPMDEDAYLYDRASMQRTFECLDREHPQVRICLNGHTHVPLVIERAPGARSPRILGAPQEVAIDPEATYLINPGSVGQPRDGNPSASFGILDTTKLVYRNVRVAYAVRETQRKIGMAGLPPQLGGRLADGR